MNNENNINPAENISLDSAETLLTASLYKFFSLLFMYPTEQTQLELISLLPSIQNLKVKNGNSTYQSCKENVLQILSTINLEEWQKLYIKTFGHISNDIPLYESNYFSCNIFKESQRLADINAFYKAFGLKVGEQTKEKLDHISIELEFLGYLTIKELYARKEGDKEKYEICIKAKKSFMEDHFYQWATKFAQNLINRSSTPFYKEVGILFDSFLDLIRK